MNRTPLRRTGPLKRHPRKSPVRQELVDELFLRDGTCVAPRIDPDCGPCWGRSTVEHVLEESRMGVRALSVIGRCVLACEGHTEPGMKAGRVWNLSHKEELRAYLLEVNA